MNEQVKEFAFQASNGMLSYDAEGEWRLSQKEVEKFANLIGKECINVIKDIPNGYPDYRNQIEDAFRIACIEEIKRKFGIE